MDIALWDLIGKACGQPLYKLFGGAKDKVVAYASMIKLSTAEERAALAQKTGRLKAGARSSSGYITETLKEDIHTVEAVRKAVGGRHGRS